MIKGFLAIDNGNGDCVVQHFEHNTIMNRPALFKAEYDRFIEDADDFARAHLFKNTHIAFGIFLDSDDAIHDIRRVGTSIIYTDHHKLFDEFETHYRSKQSVFMHIAEKLAFGTINNSIDLVNIVHHNRD